MSSEKSKIPVICLFGIYILRFLLQCLYLFICVCVCVCIIYNLVNVKKPYSLSVFCVFFFFQLTFSTVDTSGHKRRNFAVFPVINVYVASCICRRPRAATGGVGHRCNSYVCTRQCDDCIIILLCIIVKVFTTIQRYSYLPVYTLPAISLPFVDE